MQAQQLGPRPIDMPGMISRGFLSTMSVILLFIMPMLTMGLFSEEKKRGTIELLLTAPLTDLQVVLGKFFAAGAFFVILLLSTWVPMAVLYLYGSPAIGPDPDGISGTSCCTAWRLSRSACSFRP